MEEEAGHALRHSQVQLRVMDNVGRQSRRDVIRFDRLVVAKVLGDDLLPVHVVDEVREELAEDVTVVQRLATQLTADEQLSLITGRVDSVDAGVVRGGGEVMRRLPDGRCAQPSRGEQRLAGQRARGCPKARVAGKRAGPNDPVTVLAGRVKGVRRALGD